VDCRNETQFMITHLDKAVNVPFKKAYKDQGKIHELARSHDKVYIMCRRGVDSKDLTDHLLNLDGENGDIPKNFINIEGGICDWSKKIDATIPYY